MGPDDTIKKFLNFLQCAIFLILANTSGNQQLEKNWKSICKRMWKEEMYVCCSQSYKTELFK